MNNYFSLRKRGLALFVALMMCLSLLPGTALAAGEIVPFEDHQHNTVVCTTCNGIGTIDETVACPDCDGPVQNELITCEKCGGNGSITEKKFSWDNPPCPNNGYACNGCDDCNHGYAWVYEESTCDNCDGTGKVVAPSFLTCTDCEGKGTIMEKKFSWDNPPCPNNGYACNGCDDCNHGYAWVYEESTCGTCNGAGRIVDPNFSVCATCSGTGIASQAVDCTVCGATGQIPCTGQFDNGVLTAVNPDGTGTMTYTCADCGASYQSTLPAEQMAAVIAENLEIVGLTASSTGAKAGETVTFTLEVRNNSSFIDAKNLTIKVALDNGLTADNIQADGTVEFNGIDVAKGQTGKFTITAALPADAAAGMTYGASLASVSVGGVPITLSGSGAAASVRVNQYSARNIYLEGAFMGRWYNYINSTAESTRKVGTLDDLANKAFTMENLGFDTADGYWGEYVINYTSGKTWQCVGFVPYTGNFDYVNTLRQYVYSDIPQTEFQYGALAEAKAFVEAEGGVLYGGQAAAEQLAEWDTTRLSRLMSVWFVADTSVVPTVSSVEKITPVAPIMFESTSDDVKIEVTGITNTKVDLTITIGENAPVDTDVVANLAGALSKELYMQPGDRIDFCFTLRDESGRSYQFVKDSAVLGTLLRSDISGAVLGTGFDGYGIPADGNQNGYSAIPKRVFNTPLASLGVADISDAAIGTALLAKGYGVEGTDPVEVTKNYLGCYYLDYINASRKAINKQPITSFQNVTEPEIRMLLGNSDNKPFLTATETCPDVAEAYYYFYYGRMFSFNGGPVYQQMNDPAVRRALNDGIQQAFESGSSYTLTAKLDGEMTANAGQATYLTFNFGLKFKLKPAGYTVEHRYYTNGTLTGSTSEYVPAIMGDDVSSDEIRRIYRYQGNDYQFTEVVGNTSLHITGLDSGVIVLRYDRTVSTTYRYRIDHVYYTDNSTVSDGGVTGTVREISVVPSDSLVTEADRVLRYGNNDYSYTSASGAWVGNVYVITLRYDRATSPYIPPTPTPTPTPTPDPVIPDNPTPLSPAPDTGIDIEDQDVPLAAPGLNSVDHYAYIIGYTDGLVHPEANITRAEVATIFFRLMLDEFRMEHWATENSFSDVKTASWYNNGVSTSAKAGIVKGYTDGSFRPDRNITRAEFAAIAARFLSDEVNVGASFSDISGHWAEEEINRAVMAGWIKGYTDGTFHPDQPITRAEAVTMINRMLDRTPDKDHLLEDMIRWADNTEDKWYYADMQEATNSHDYERLEMILIEDWTELLDNRDWVQLEKEWSTASSAPGAEVADNLDLSNIGTNTDGADADGESTDSENA